MEARLVWTKAQIYLAPEGSKGDKERWRQGVMENLTIVVHDTLVSPLLVSLASSLLSHAQSGLLVLRDLSHCKSL